MAKVKAKARKVKQPPLVPGGKNVAGIDIGSTEHYVCGPTGADGEANVKVFGTTTPELKNLADWLTEQQVESVAMESTYLYWIPIYELLESRGFEVVLADARQMHNVPGRKTDVSDCQWIQILHSCGLLQASFRPGDAIVAMRAIYRQMSNLVGEKTRFIQWMQKALDQMNVQVHRAVTDLTGKTGMSIVRAIVAGERSTQRLAALRDPRCAKSEEEIVECLTGNWREEHLFNLASALELFDSVSEQIAAYEARLQEMIVVLQPPERQDEEPPPHPNPTKGAAMRRKGEEQQRIELWRLSGVDLSRIDGISPPTAQVVFTEVGLDLSAFPDEKHFVSWLRLSPRTPISGGKPLKKKTRNGRGASRISAALRMSALSLNRSKTALGAAYRRISRHKGGTVAVFATARKLAQLIFRALRFGSEYTDIGAQAYEAQFEARRLAGLKASANALGFTLVPVQ